MRSILLTLLAFGAAGCDNLATVRCDTTADTACGEILHDQEVPGVSLGSHQRALPDGSLGFVGNIDADERDIALLDAFGAVRWSTPLDGFYPFWSVDFDGDGAAAGVLYGSRRPSVDPIFDGVRFDASGVEVWRTPIPQPPPTFLSGKVALDDQGGIAVAAVFGEAGSLQGMTLFTRLDEDGAVMWQTTYDFSLEWFRAVPDGGYQVLANCDDFDPCLVRLAEDGAEIARRALDYRIYDPVPTNDGGLVGSLDSFGLVRISADGGVVWTREFVKGEDTIDGPTYGHVGSVALGPAGSVWASFRFTDGADLGGGPLVGGLAIARFDADGEHVWSRGIEYDCGGGSTVAVTPSGEASFYCGSWFDVEATDAEPAGRRFSWHLLRFSP